MAAAATAPEFKLFVRNLSYSVTNEQLYSMFAEHGEITFARLATDRETQRSRGFGFVSYSSKAAADRAIEKLNGTELDGRNIEVKEAENNRDRPPRAEGGAPRGGSYGGDRGAPRGNFNKSQECFAFKKGNCTRGDGCRFSHEGGGGGSGGGSRPRDNYEDSAPRKQYRQYDEGGYNGGERSEERY